MTLKWEKIEPASNSPIGTKVFWQACAGSIKMYVDPLAGYFGPEGTMWSARVYGGAGQELRVERAGDLEQAKIVAEYLGRALLAITVLAFEKKS